MNPIPDDSYYNAEPETECNGEDWERCLCEACQNIREDYADMLHERRRDEGMGL